MAGLRMGFLMDPLEGVRVGHDTTFALMLECARRRHTVFTLEQRDLSVQSGVAHARMRQVDVRAVVGDHFDVVEVVTLPLDTLDVLFLRKDPPVDVEFVQATRMVEVGVERTVVLNAPSALRDVHEKLFALRFPELVPETVVTRETEALSQFVHEVGGRAILKPMDGFGGKAVLLAREEDPNLRALIEVSTECGTRAVIAQRYLDASREGDKRILLLEGEPIGAVLRVPRADDVRANLAVGGTAARASLTARDREICERLGPELRARGLFLVGIDVIGHHLIEVNVTSPTGLVEVDALEGVRLEETIIDRAERRVIERRDALRDAPVMVH